MSNVIQFPGSQRSPEPARPMPPDPRAKPVVLKLELERLHAELVRLVAVHNQLQASVIKLGEWYDAQGQQE